MEKFDADIVEDVNLLAEFLSDSPLQPDFPTLPVDCIVLCASAVLHGAESIFSALTANPSLTGCLVLCGGIGHSTSLMYDAIKQHPHYFQLGEEVQGLPEARLLEKILDTFFDRSTITSEGCRILVEGQSTNCGQNAVFSRALLEKEGYANIRTCMVIQDPTMMLRTRASFEKAYESAQYSVSITSYPAFIPRVQMSAKSSLEYNGSMAISGLWDMSRFLQLIMGEIPRLRDDQNGYGPRGRGFITHVAIPDYIENAWSRLQRISGQRR